MDNAEDQEQHYYDPRGDVLTLITIYLTDEGADAEWWTVEKIVDVLDARTSGEYFLLAQALAATAAGFADVITNGNGRELLRSMALDKGQDDTVD